MWIAYRLRVEIVAKVTDVANRAELVLNGVLYRLLFC